MVPFHDGIICFLYYVEVDTPQSSYEQDWESVHQKISTFNKNSTGKY